MAKILAPNKQYTGISASVPFVNGMGETDNPGLIEWFKEKGYEVVDEDSVSNPNKELEDMTKPELETVAKAYEVEYNSRVTKDELIKLIKVKAGYSVEE